MGIFPSEIHDFSAAVNPYPLPEEIRVLINHEGIKAYPDYGAFAMVSALSGLLDVSQEMGKDCVSMVSSVKNMSNLLVLKSLTEPFGIGGLRIGYAVADEKLVAGFKIRLLPRVFHQSPSGLYR
jgi:histidinol-phosphate/aromatic aminotransferase/cobyric acid decarboxylase-like protein